MRKSMMKNIYRTLSGLVVATLVLLGVTTVYGQQPAKTPSGTFEMKATSVAVGIGFEWGQGILYFKGQPYAFSVDGLSAVGVGITQISAKGSVYNLQDVADFEGTYAGGGAGMTIGGGGASVEVKNEKGVVLTFETVTSGVKLAIGGGGLKIKVHPAGQ
jgi:hypothetical protein